MLTLQLKLEEESHSQAMQKLRQQVEDARTAVDNPPAQWSSLESVKEQILEFRKVKESISASNAELRDEAASLLKDIHRLEEELREYNAIILSHDQVQELQQQLTSLKNTASDLLQRRQAFRQRQKLVQT